MIDKALFILRSVSNSGKSTFADFIKYLSADYYDVLICSADDYHYDEAGNYNFDYKKLNQAHKQCQEKFLYGLKEGFRCIIIANTNTKTADFQFYIDEATKNNYKIFSLVLEKRFEGGDNGHNVPLDTLIKQEKNIKESLKLR